MKLVIEFDSNRKLARVTFHGCVDDNTIVESYKRMGQAASAYRPDTAILDFSDVSSFDVTPATIRQLASLPPNLPDPHPRCVVTPQDLIFGMVRMFQILGEEKRKNLQVVRSMTEAYKVLGIPGDPEFQIYETIQLRQHLTPNNLAVYVTCMELWHRCEREYVFEQAALYFCPA